MRVVVAMVLVLGACKRQQTVVKDDTSDDVVPTGLSGPGEPCDTTVDCEDALVCASLGVCASAGDYGTTPFGEDCEHTLECESGLVCANGGLCSGPGVAGTAGIDEVCATINDCQAGLTCYAGTCEGFPVPFWEGADCPAQAAPFRVLFDIPRANVPATEDFFRLPFPNVIRALEGEVDLTGMPSPGLLFGPAGDVPADLIEAYTDSFDGFGPNQAVFFRLSQLPTFDTVTVGLPGEGSIALIDLTEGDPAYGTRHATGWKLTTNRPYVCDPWIALYPSSGRPFLPGHTYAAVITSDLKGPELVDPVQAPDFASMLGGPPADSGLQASWEAYEPLRTWMASADIDASTLAGASVFTVEDTRLAAQRARDVVRGATSPVVTNLVWCQGLPGPFATPTDPRRGCFSQDASFQEIQGALSVPLFQTGSAPFKDLGDGGAANWTAGQPVIAQTGSMTFAMTLPTGAMPATGWPVVLFAHDGDGNYRSFIEDGLAGALASVTPPGGTPTGFAVISVDTWLTGPRAGNRDPAWEDIPGAYEPGVLYDNPLNPLAARDNRLQSAADWAQVIRFLEGLDWSVAGSPTGAPVLFDLEHVYFVGHGLGASAGPVFAAYEPRIDGVVLAAAGGAWFEGLTSVTEPFAYDALIGPALADAGVNRFHPLLNLAQGIVDRTDPVNHAADLHYTAGVPNRDVLHVVGVGDGQVGEDAQAALARSLFAEQVVQPGGVALDRIDQVSAPVTQNVAGATAVVLVAGGADPHRLLFEDARIRAQVAAFLASSVSDGRATLFDDP